MTYFMIVIIWYSGVATETKIPMDNYEHCMEMKEYILDSLKSQFNHQVITAACPPIEP